MVGVLAALNNPLDPPLAQPALLTLLATLLLRYRHIPIRAYTFAGMRTRHYAGLAQLLDSIEYNTRCPNTYANGSVDGSAELIGIASGSGAGNAACSTG